MVDAQSDELATLRAELEASRAEVARLTRCNRDLQAAIPPLPNAEPHGIATTLQAFAQSGLDVSEKGYLSLLVQLLARALGVDYVVVGELDESDAVHCLACCAHGRTSEELSLPLAGEPCERTIRQEVFLVPRGAQHVFPDASLHGLQPIEAFGGIALREETGQVLGILAAMHGEAFAQPDAVEPLLRMVSASAAAEIRRRRAGSAAARKTLALERAHAELLAHSQRIEAEIAQRNRELTSEKALVDHIIASIPVGILYLDRELIVRWTNAEQLRLMGVAPERVVHRSVLDLFPGLSESESLFETVLNDAEAVRFSGYPLAVGSRTAYIDGKLVPIFEEDRSVKGILLFAMEVSARVENERLQQAQIASLRELDLLKGDFINAASHELRTPLTSITGYAEFLEDEVGGPLTTDQRGFVTQIQEGAKRLQRIVDDMLDFARLEAGSFKLVLREADLGLLIQEELGFVQPQAQEANLTLRTELPSAPLRVPMDPSRIGQVLLNLLGNAIKFTPSGGTVTIALGTEGDSVRVEVRDTGIGISEAYVGRLFQKFFQVDPSMTRERGGAGLGLSIAKALVEAHGGRIGVESRPGVGSIFWFTLPRLGEVEETAPVLE